MSWEMEEDMLISTSENLFLTFLSECHCEEERRDEY